MYPRLPASWQLHPQDAQLPPRAYNPPQNLNYSLIPIGPALTGVVASNEEIASFAQKFPTINRIQHILADGRYQEYFCYGHQATIKEDIENCFHDSVAFIKDQQQALQGDFSILTAYDCEIRKLELKLIAYEAQEISATKLVAGYQKSDKAHEINRSLLLMMRSRAALLRQDVGMRRDLLKIDVAINKFATVAISLHLRIKFNMMAGIQNDVVAREEFYMILNGLLPWNTMREQRRAELQRCRETRAGLEKRIGAAKARLQVLEQVRCGMRQEQACVGMASR